MAQLPGRIVILRSSTMSSLADRRTAISSVIKPQGLKSSQKVSMSLRTVSQSCRQAPEDENVAINPDEDLLWPKPEAIHTWWKHHQGQFRPGTRHLFGKPMNLACSRTFAAWCPAPSQVVCAEPTPECAGGARETPPRLWRWWRCRCLLP